ncbi:glycosyltransferase family 4 protein [Rhodoferax sp.]|uniref:glycosyltransferase family 4 protein n=1 Tax=Rhodoferax sp. TaxID=50421 RepID=UPI0027346E3E|nr:glycosyltransferase family 4 protein [Rhodoferax sp.]MDP3192349.1 glycosyltransferase family 4 protein [Rhodoferax sp.]
MRILVVSQYFWPEGFRINEVTKSLVEKGIQVDVLTGKPNYPEGKIFEGYRIGGCLREQYCGANISRVPLIPRGKNNRIRLALNYLSFIVSGLVFGPWLKRGRKYDVIFVYGLSPLMLALPALFLGWLKKVPVVIWVQDLWPQSLSATGYVRNRFILWAVEQVVRFIYRHADLLLVQSRAFVEPVRVLASGTPIKYYPNSVDGSFAVPATGKTPDVPGLEGGFSVMFAGNIGAAQGVEVIVEAATLLKDHKDIQFVVLGDGSCRPWMLQQVKARNLKNLHLPGRFPVETMPGFMQKASALLVTLAEREIFAATVPNKVQAYMAAGRPIIACLPGEGARLVVEAKAGMGVRAEDGKALAEAVLGLYRMAESERDEMGRNGRAYFHENFDHERLVDELIEELHEVVQKKESIQ